jgi:hypothetical protein
MILKVFSPYIPWGRLIKYPPTQLPRGLASFFAMDFPIGRLPFSKAEIL